MFETYWVLAVCVLLFLVVDLNQPLPLQRLCCHVWSGRLYGSKISQ